MTKIRVRVGPNASVPLWLIPAVLVIVFAWLGLRSLSSGVAPPTYDYAVAIAPGLSPNWTPQAAAASVLDKIAINERLLGRRLAPPKVLSVEAIPGSGVSPAIDAEGNLGSYSVVWIVKASGTFVAQFGPAGAERASASDGYYLFDDTGTTLGSGFPLR